MLRILSLIISVIVVVWSIIFFTGYNTNEYYQNTIVFTTSNNIFTTWQQLVNFKQIPERKKDVVSVDILEEYGRLVAWQENLKNGGYRIYRTNKRTENKELILELTESTEGLTGVWTFELEPSGTETIVTISEQSKLTKVLRRGYYRIFNQKHNLLVWQKYIKVGLVQSLLNTP
jgi:hypothetical protein